MSAAHSVFTTVALATLLATGCQPVTSQTLKKGKAKVKYEVVKTDDEWKQTLTPLQYRVTRQRGTESAFGGKYYKHKADGTYKCVCCDQVLFDAREKYDSGSGWPSFWKATNADNVQQVEDARAGMLRSEILCSRCGAHLGHVFDDGPRPTGLRYCVNSVALRFAPRPEPPRPGPDE